MAEAGSDPRTDRHPEREGGGSPDAPSNSEPKPAPGGVGTGTKGDPADSPDAGAGKKS